MQQWVEEQMEERYAGRTQVLLAKMERAGAPSKWSAFGFPAVCSTDSRRVVPDRVLKLISECISGLELNFQCG